METLWTQDDLQAVKQAILDLSTGKRVAEVEYSGSNGTTKKAKYTEADLPSLRRLFGEIRSELAAADGSGAGCVSTVTTKGL